ncbi:MAG: heme-binding protein [Eubacteriaceae bacterium]|nr:heme-binding protein [Eubacteriaceae bacterium]
MARYERPKFEVILTESSFELRKYKDFYIVEYSNENDPEIENGFGTLFRYISRENKTLQKISMTVPVIEEIAGNQMKMAFVVPKMQWDHIPEPNSHLLSVKKFESGIFAVIKYSGFSNEGKEHIMIEKLSDWVVAKNYQEASNYMLAFFNPPFTPPMFRHNEIMVRVV